MNKRILYTIFFLAISLSSVNSFAKNTLIGKWENKKITLELKINHRYKYSVKILGISKDFKGRWSTKTVTKRSGKKVRLLILTYKLFGEHRKVSEYSFRNGRLKLIQDGKVHYLKRI